MPEQPLSWRRIGAAISTPTSELVVVDGGSQVRNLGNRRVDEVYDGVLAIGFGDPYALPQRALIGTRFGSETIVERSLRIAGDLCVYNRMYGLEAWGAYRDLR
jgi:ATP-dependent protease HslVU (ClpYQ) peptidase subunit